MAWTRSQEDLRGAVVAPLRHGLATVVVFAEYCAGCTRLMLSLMRESRQGAGPRVLSVTGVFGVWDIITMLSRIASTTGLGHTGRLLNAIHSLSDSGKRAVVLVVEDAHFLTTRQMEALVLCLERVAAEVNVNIRVVFMFKQAKYWRRRMEKGQDGTLFMSNSWESAVDWPPMPQLFQERLKAGTLTLCELKRQGIEALSRKTAREEIAERVALAS